MTKVGHHSRRTINDVTDLGSERHATENHAESDSHGDRRNTLYDTILPFLNRTEHVAKHQGHYESMGFDDDLKRIYKPHVATLTSKEISDAKNISVSNSDLRDFTKRRKPGTNLEKADVKLLLKLLFARSSDIKNIELHSNWSETMLAIACVHLYIR